MNIEEIIQVPEPRVSVKAEIREVVRDIREKPHVFIRVRLSGWHFPERAPEPFLVVGKAVSRFVIIDPDGAAADAYFDVEPKTAKRVSFGYGNIISWDFDVAVDPKTIERLDRKRLPKGTVDLEGRRSRARRR